MSRPDDQTAPTAPTAQPVSTAPKVPTAPQLPQHFGRYVLLETIGHGGMAEVFRAVAHGADGVQRAFVVKRILAERLADQKVSRDFVEMFINEARISALLNHPNIVQVHDSGQIEGSYFLAMEYLRGKDLLTLLRELQGRGRLMPPELAAYIALQVATGLHHAHSLTQRDGKALHVVHRDVSPSNIMLLRAGGVKLLDFGIAKAELEAEKPGTLSGPVKGKLAYLSPEQVRNEALDGRSDVFSLGVVLWECLTGKRLFFDKTDYSTMKNVLERPVPPPSTQRFDLPPQLDYIVVRALERELSQRYPNAKGLAEDLESYLGQAHFSPSALPRLLDELFGEDKPEAGEPVTVPVPPPASEDRPELIAIGADEPQRSAADALPMGSAAAVQPADLPKRTTGSSPAVGSQQVSAQNEQLRAALTADAQRLAVKRRSPLPFVVAGLLLVGGAAAFVLKGGGGAPVAPQSGMAPPPAVVPVGAPAGEAAPSAQAAAPIPATAAAPPVAAKPVPKVPAGMVSIRLETAPPGAQVKGPQDTALGLTPTTVTFPRSKQPIVLVFDLAGFRPARHSLVPDRDVTALVTLHQAPKGKRGKGKAADKGPPIEEEAAEIKIIDGNPSAEADRSKTEAAASADLRPPGEAAKAEPAQADELVKPAAAKVAEPAVPSKAESVRDKDRAPAVKADKPPRPAKSEPSETVTKPEGADKPAPREPAKPEGAAKPEPAKPEPPKPEPNPEPTKAEGAAKAEPPKPEAKPEPGKSEPAKPEGAPKPGKAEGAEKPAKPGPGDDTLDPFSSAPK